MARFVLGVVLVLGTLVSAQIPALTGALADVRVQGSPENTTLIKTVIRSRSGTPVEQINLESERNLVLSLGLFSEVSVRLEEQPSGPVLAIRVRENPRIASVNIEGSTIATQAQWLGFLEQFLITPGTPYNTIRAAEAISAIKEQYRAGGFPFDVPVTLDVSPVTAEDEDEVEPVTDAEATEDVTEIVDGQIDDTAALNSDEPVTLSYRVSEEEPIREIFFEDSSVLDESTLTTIFRPLDNSGIFTPEAYETALRQVSEAYREQGYRGSGVDVETTELIDGILTVRFRELEILAIDTTAIGVDQDDVSLGVGDLFNYDVLLEDVRRFATGDNRDISLDIFQLSTGDVRVTFLAGPPGEAGEINEIVLEGNTVISDEAIYDLLSLNVGDNFTSTLAQEDFEAIQQLYLDAGYRIAGIPSYNYLDGVYSQRLTELKIGGYEIRFDSDSPKSEEFLVTRYLPDVGTVYNENSFRRGILNALRLQAFEVTNVVPNLGENPDELIIQISVRELPTGQFRPQITYETSADASNFFAGVEYADTNFLGRAHNISTELTARTSDVGFQVGGNVSYSIPWIYIDELDFKEVPTRVSGSLFSNVTTDQVMNSGGSIRVCYSADGDILEDCDTTNQQAFVGDYTKRETGLGFGVGRQIAPFTNLSLSARGGYSEYKLEPGPECEFNDDGTIENRNCALPEELALDFLPQSGLNGRVTTAITYDDRDNANFPREGISANAQVGVGFGSDYRDPDTGARASYVYAPLEFGVRTYVQLSNLIPEMEDPNHVAAFKLTGGHQLGEDYPTSRYFSVGDSFVNDTLIRGYRRGDINASKSYAVLSAEYRYDFALDTVATQTIIGLAFADIGYASSVPNFDDYATPLLAGGGVGVQINLGLGGFLFPAVRADYSFSGTNPTGIFRFRLGPVF